MGRAIRRRVENESRRLYQRRFIGIRAQLSPGRGGLACAADRGSEPLAGGAIGQKSLRRMEGVDVARA